VHDYLSRRRKHPASLIFGLKFASIGRHGSLKQIKPRVDFEDLPGVEGTTCPGIISHAPFESEERQKIIEAQIQKKHGKQVCVSADSNIVGVKGGTKVTISDEQISNYTAQHFGRGTAATIAHDKGCILASGGMSSKARIQLPKIMQASNPTIDSPSS